MSWAFLPLVNERECASSSEWRCLNGQKLTTVVHQVYIQLNFVCVFFPRSEWVEWGVAKQSCQTITHFSKETKMLKCVFLKHFHFIILLLLLLLKIFVISFEGLGPLLQVALFRKKTPLQTHSCIHSFNTNAQKYIFKGFVLNNIKHIFVQRANLATVYIPWLCLLKS